MTNEIINTKGSLNITNVVLPTNTELSDKTVQIYNLLREGQKCAFNIAEIILDVYRRPELLEQDGFTTVDQWAEKYFGYGKASTYHFIKIAQRFTQDDADKYGMSVLRTTNVLDANTAVETVANRFGDGVTYKEAVDIVKEIKNNNVIDVEYKEVDYKYDHDIDHAQWFEIYVKGQPEMPVRPETDDEDEIADYEDMLVDYEDALAEYNKSAEIVKNNQALYDAASKSKPVKPIKKGMNPDEYSAKLEQYNQDVVEYEKAKAICDEYLAERNKYKKAKKAEDKKRSAQFEKELNKRIDSIRKLSAQLHPDYQNIFQGIKDIWYDTEFKLPNTNKIELNIELEAIVFNNLIDAMILYHGVMRENAESSVIDLLRTLKPEALEPEQDSNTEQEVETNE